MYVGGRIGCGHIFELNEKLGIDASVKYFFTNQGSKMEMVWKEKADR
jgi:hypothetical protein